MEKKAGTNVVSQLIVVIFAAAVFHFGCGAGCSCANKDSTSDESRTRESETKKATSLSSSSITRQPLTPADLIRAGRMYEYGKYAEAWKVLERHCRESDRTRFLGAMIADRLGKHTEVIALLGDGFQSSHSELKERAQLLRIDALAKLERYDEAVREAKQVVDAEHTSKSERRDMLERMGDLLMRIRKFTDAAANFEQAARWAGPSKADRLTVKQAHALLMDNQQVKAQQLLTPLALTNSQKQVMNEANALLREYNLLPKLTVDARLKRLQNLLDNKSWDEADAEIANMSEYANGSVAKELRWQKANLLFSRRNHYKEAYTALELVVKDGAPYGDQAAFLAARALSRMDRDEEAIAAFFAYAGKTRNRANADKARFYAARLEFYLGKHKDALTHFEKFIGNGRKKIPVHLDGGTLRDAHFLAGMSAYLEKKYKVAEAHFTAASDGSTSADAIQRNEYWQAVCTFETARDIGKRALESVCQKDNTSWYAFFAAARLIDAGETSDVCTVVLPEMPSSAELPAQMLPSSSPAAEMPQPTLTLAQLSSNANLYAGMGLFRPAAEALNRVEKGNTVQADKKDWILHYLLLDAPQYAIRNASLGLNWDRRNDDIWLAMTAYPIPYEYLVYEQQQRHSLPSFLIYAIARKESLFDPFAVSHVGAMGMMQMMPATYETNRKRAGLPKLADGALPTASESIIAGGFELAHLLELFSGNLPLAIMAYNGGSKAVERWVTRSGEFPMDVFVEKAGFAQTRNYVRRVYQNLVRYCQLYSAPLPSLPRRVASSTTKK